MWSHGNLVQTTYVMKGLNLPKYVGEKIVDKIVGRHSESFTGEEVAKYPYVGDTGTSAEEAVILNH